LRANERNIAGSPHIVNKVSLMPTSFITASAKNAHSKLPINKELSTNKEDFNRSWLS
jgi:hypothetical protein